MKTPDQILADMAATYKERSASYGDNWLKLGNVMQAMFPDGLTLKTPEDWNKFHLWFLSLIKMTRLAETKFSHQDSAHDNAVYAAMLESIIPAAPINAENPPDISKEEIFPSVRFKVNGMEFLVARATEITFDEIIKLSKTKFKYPSVEYCSGKNKDFWCRIALDERVKISDGMRIWVKDSSDFFDRKNYQGDCQ